MQNAAVVYIVFSYPDDPLIRASLREFRVYPVDDYQERLAPPVTISPGAIPTAENPFPITMPIGATEVEVVAVDLDGNESVSVYA